jgi:serine/threonine-protein kinase RsbW
VTKRKRAGAEALRLEVPSRIEMVGTADALVDRVATAAGFDDDARHDIQIAVHEALVNAVEHGNGGDDSRSVRLEIEVLPGHLEVSVRDEGRGFDPSGVPDPRAPENHSRPSGRGILMMKELMDEAIFRRSPGGGMEVTLRKRLPGAGELPPGPVDPSRPRRVRRA